MNPENHPKFLANLDDSEPFRWLVARWLSGRGYVVRVPPMSKAETRAEWKNHVDSGDLEICQRVEVKHLLEEFTCRRDWPFKERFIACERNSFDRAKPKPFAFIYVNISATHAAMLVTTDWRKWTVERVKDSRYNEEQDFYFAPIEQVIFSPLEMK